MSEKVFANFPYDRKFTREEIAELTDRAGAIADALRDGVAPNGAVLYLEESMLQLWSVHAALAGVYVDPDRAFIVSVPLPDQSGQFEDSVQWVLREEAPAAPDAEEVDAEAQQIVAALNDRLSPQVRRRVAEQFAAAFTAANETEEN
ncbi:hypothetical protein SEA_FRANCOIS_23 [Gordonia phage Francois]|nr:hypothetical protein SEA_FRANCOIS_23 [Gordonia phage Francois]